jgi:hypothetical protein
MDGIAVKWPSGRLGRGFALVLFPERLGTFVEKLSRPLGSRAAERLELFPVQVIVVLEKRLDLVEQPGAKVVKVLNMSVRMGVGGDRK